MLATWNLREFGDSKAGLRGDEPLAIRNGWPSSTTRARFSSAAWRGRSKKDDPRRVEEIRALAKFLAARVSDAHPWAKNMILLGDFNIFSPEDVTFAAIVDAGFHVPKQITKLPANVEQNKHYDQIAFIAPDIRDLELCDAGVFNVYKHVYTDAEEKVYARENTSKLGYRQWRTFQMSDHLPMWIELQIDFSERYLKRKRGDTDDGGEKVRRAPTTAAAPPRRRARSARK